MKKKLWPSSKIKWRQSLITKAILYTSMVILCGYFVSLFVTVQGINSVFKLAYDPAIESALNNHLDLIKKVYHFKQQEIINKLKSTSNIKNISDDKLKNLLDSNIKGIKIKHLNKASINALQKEGTELIAWTAKEKLRVFDRMIIFPKGDIYQQFQKAQNILQRYQLLGVKLENEIRPTLIKSNVVVLIVTFILLIGAYIFIARRTRHAVLRVVKGFSHWAQDDFEFRFKGKWGGELKLITSQFNAMANEVEKNRKKTVYLQKIASWQTIARKIAHEIKNPLTPIQMMVSQLKRRYNNEDPEFTKLLDNAQEIITEEISSLRRMVDNFSQFARLPTPSFSNRDIVSILNHVVELERAAFPQHNIEFETQITSAKVKVDEDLFRQVIINLIKNAAEAGGSEVLKIKVLLTKYDENNFAVSVVDNGPGIPEEIQNRIFEAYFTTKHSGPTPGMGLGLAVCQKIILDHEGNLLLKSQPGHTEFSIILPEQKEGKNG